VQGQLRTSVRIKTAAEPPAGLREAVSCPLSPGKLLAKRVFDLAAVTFLLFLLSPILLVVAAAVYLIDGPPVIFRQIRMGKGGTLFTLFKFRTMVRNAESLRPLLQQRSEVPGPVFKMRRDPRVTKLGRFLRFFSLDELPQLFNVLKGDMSLVGPRPALPEEVARYEPWQKRRLSVPPGMTCTWQACGRSDIPFEEWVRMDLAYIDSWSLWQDAAILLRTIPAVLFARGAW